MAFNNKNMSVVAYCNGFTFWHYRSDDFYENMENGEYFPKSIVDLMANGDIIIINSGDGTVFRVIKIVNNGRGAALEPLKS